MNFSIVESFSIPVVPLVYRASIINNIKYGSAIVEEKYNSYGYRTHEFDTIKSDYGIVVGCSHTEGTATPEEFRYGNV